MRTILVVDDMAIFREPIEAVLRANGYRVLTASNGVEALAAVSGHHPDLMLLDLSMPQMDGMTVLRTLRQNDARRNIKIIIMSADADRARISDAIRLGIAGYIIKSHFSLKSLMERVEKALMPSDPTAKHAGAHSANPDGVLATGRAPEAAPSAPNAIAHTVPEIRKSITAHKPRMTRTEVMQRVNADNELKGLSPTISQVLNLTASDRCSMEEVAKAVSQDQAIALKLLKLANSPIYSRGDRVDTVHKAVLRIGVASIREAVLNIGVVERFESVAFEHHLNTQLFWEHSIACGLIATELARELEHKEPDSAFTAGLLHDLGRIIFAERLGEDYTAVLDAARDAQVPVEVAESRLLMVNHADVMGKLLLAWRFPKELVNPVVFHHTPPDDVRTVAPHQGLEVLRLGLADRVAHALMLGSSGNDVIYPTETHSRLLGVQAATIKRIEETARQKTDDTKFALLTSSNGATWQRPTERYRSELGVPFRPLFISTTPEIDAYRMFCAELGGPQTAEPPNIAVVHIATAKDRACLSERLVASERDAGAGVLPTIALSPDGKFGLDEVALAGRAVITLPTPTPILSFVKASSSLLAVTWA